MPDQADEGMLAGLRSLMDQRGIKLTALAASTKVPYRSLQNYFSGKTQMPVSVYLKICKALDLEGHYFERERFEIDYYALRKALLAALGEGVPRSEFMQDGSLALVANGDRRRSEAELLRDAGTLTAFVQSRYDIEREVRASQPHESDGEENSAD